MDENTRKLAEFLLSDDARMRRQRQNLALAGYDTSGYQPTFGPGDSNPEQAGPEVGPMRRSPVNPIVAGPDQASFLTSEKDTRPHWETDQRAMLMPLVMSGYNNSASYGVPSFFGGHAWSTMGDIVKGNAVHPDEIAHSANDAAGAAMLGSMPMSAPRGAIRSGAARTTPETGIRAYHGASSPYEGDVYKPKKSQYNAFFAAESPELANVFARSYGEAPRVYPVDIAPTAKLFDAAANPDDAAKLLAAYESNPGLLEKNYLVGKETIKKWLTSADSGLMEDRGVQKWLRKNGYDGWKFADSAAPPSAGDNRSAVGMLKPGHVFSATTGDLLYSNPKTSAAAPLALEAMKDKGGSGIRAYHGSPHDFDRFDMSKIGTGEGAQAFGHGLYFAENEGVAKYYRDALSTGPLGPFYSKAAVGGKAFDPEDPLHVAAGAIYDYGRLQAPFKFAADVSRSPDDQVAAEALKLLRSKSLLTIPKLEPEAISRGKMYEVNIKADPNDFLDWDKPLSQQSEKVRAAFPGTYHDMTGAAAHDAYASALAKPVADPTDWSGIVNTINDRVQDRGALAAALRQANIPGIKYLDQGSRAAGKGSHNYVVFDDKLVEILRKYGLAGILAGGYAMTGQEPQE